MAKQAPNAKFQRKPATLTVRANPYHAISAEGLLAGACRVAEAVRQTTQMPLRKYVGAKLVVDDYIPAAQRNSARTSGLLSKQQAHFEFAAGPVVVHAPGELGTFYFNRIRTGELIDAKDDAAALRALADMRALAIESYRGAYGKDPAFDLWAEQFPEDGKIADLMTKRTKAAAPATDAKHASAK